MILLLAFAFIGGVVTVLSPCILPVLPIILTSSAGGGRRRPLGVITGFIISFTFFTLFLATIVKATGIPSNTLRSLSIVIIAAFGLSLLVPKFQVILEGLFAKLSRYAPQSQNKTGFMGGLVIGISLGLLWTPCVGPILAGVISLAISGSVTGQAVFITLAYSAGTAIPMFILIWTGSKALQKVPWLVANTGKIQKAFGILMILTAIGISQNVDRQFQNYVLEKFPQYGAGLTKLEDNDVVKSALEDLNGNGLPKEDMGKPMNEIIDQTYPTAPEIIPGGEWLNLPAGRQVLTLSELRGKVVLIDFWTYSCINCIRTLPYLGDWWGKYKDDGFVIIGVHSPEFEFEKSVTNLQSALKDFGQKYNTTYPVVQDNNFDTWRAYKNHYWPAKYLIDKDGKIRYTHFGEGDYNETEQKIQELLGEMGTTVTAEIDNPDYEIYSRTPETYLGTSRFNGFGYVDLNGDWVSTEEYVESKSGNALTLDFESKNVFLVMRSDSETQVKVYLDGEEVKTITVNEDKLYELVNLDEPGKHTIKLEFLEDGTQAFAFTFG